MFDHIFFQHPSVFYLLLLIPVYVAWYVWKRNTLNATVQISTLRSFSKVGTSWRSRFRHLPMVLRMGAFAAIVCVLARPQSSDTMRDQHTEGIDIVMAIDVSMSMQAVDVQPNRLEAAKGVAMQFVNNRVNDNIGLVVFGAESVTMCPLTIDHVSLVNIFSEVNFGMLPDGTAIGMGLATSVNRLRNSQAKSKVVILLTDGENNRGRVAPLTAAQMAKEYGIKVYTIAVGRSGMVKFPVQTVFGTKYEEFESKVDEKLLADIANLTGGKSFRAYDRNGLQAIYDEIDQMEKTKLEVQEYERRSEEYLPFAILAVLLLLAELLLRNTILRTLP